MAKRKTRRSSGIASIRKRAAKYYDQIASDPDSFVNRWADPRRALPKEPPAPPYDGKRILKQFAEDLPEMMRVHQAAFAPKKKSRKKTSTERSPTR